VLPRRLQAFWGGDGLPRVVPAKLMDLGRHVELAQLRLRVPMLGGEIDGGVE
jgi:hypothetical protein